MTRKKLDTETIYKIMFAVFSTGSFTEASKILNIPVKTIEVAYKRNIEKEEFQKLKIQKNDEFVEKATNIMNVALERMLKDLLDKDKNISLNALTRVIDVMYDKKALSEGKPTQNINNYESLIKKVSDENEY